MTRNKLKNDVKTVSLVLGSGGARGLAHIGVIKWLEEHQFEIKSISGCSIGSLIGGVYAAGKLDELERWLLTLDKLNIASLLDPTWRSGGIFKGDKIIKTLIDLLEDIQIENLPIPFTAVATDIINEKEVWFKSGSLFDAVRASSSLPLFFTPVEYEGSLLIDGGVLNPVPIAPIFNDDTDLTVAVNLGGALMKDKIEVENKIYDIKEESLFAQGLKKFVKSYNEKEDGTSTKEWGMYDIADKAFDTMQSTIAKVKIASYPPDVEVRIARNACGMLEFDRTGEMIKLGYEMTQLAFEENNSIEE